jgi:hypothetical protein
MREMHDILAALLAGTLLSAACTTYLLGITRSPGYRPSNGNQTGRLAICRRRHRMRSGELQPDGQPPQAPDEVGPHQRARPGHPHTPQPRQ